LEKGEESGHADERQKEGAATATTTTTRTAGEFGKGIDPNHRKRDESIVVTRHAL
jgi:hypothetical protein